MTFNSSHREERKPSEGRRVTEPQHQSVHLPGLLADEFGISRSEARRHLNTGGVRLDGRVLQDFDLPAGLVDGKTIRLGKCREVTVSLPRGE